MNIEWCSLVLLLIIGVITLQSAAAKDLTNLADRKIHNNRSKGRFLTSIMNKFPSFKGVHKKKSNKQPIFSTIISSFKPNSGIFTSTPFTEYMTPSKISQFEPTIAIMPENPSAVVPVVPPPTGPIAPTGSNNPGPTGPTGPTGDNNGVGPTGPTGDNTAVRPTGPTGPTADNNGNGPTGPSGDNTAVRPTGPTGPTADNNANGPTGPSGPTDDNNANGPEQLGPTGPSLRGNENDGIAHNYIVRDVDVNFHKAARRPQKINRSNHQNKMRQANVRLRLVKNYNKKFQQKSPQLQFGNINFGIRNQFWQNKQLNLRRQRWLQQQLNRRRFSTKQFF